MPKTYVSPLAMAGATALAALLASCADGMCDDGACEDPIAEPEPGPVGGAGNGPSGGSGEGGEGATSTNGGGGNGPSIDVSTPRPTGQGGSAGGGRGPEGGTGNTTGGRDAGPMTPMGGSDGGMPSGGGQSGEGGRGGAPMTGCAGDGDCSGGAPVCDLDLAQCVECLLADDSGCAGDTPYCVGADNSASECVECRSVEDCGFEAPLCDDGACVACMTEGDCVPFSGTPLCRDDGQCVACLSEAECEAGEPVCDETGRCTGCSDSEECAHLAATPVCDADNGGCVECVSNTDCGDPTAPRCDGNACAGCAGPADCMGFEGLNACNGSTGECVQCVANTDCSAADASACVNNACAACSADADCAHVPGKTVCDTSQGAGVCVQCTGVKDDACTVAGTEYVCDSLNRTCASATEQNEVGSAIECDRCLSDAHCATGRACTSTEFAGQQMGWFCQWVREAGACADYQPFLTFRAVQSLDGAPAPVCSLSGTTCQAYNQHYKSPKVCATSEECGAEGVADAGCDGTLGYCAMACGSVLGCEGTSTCSGGYCTF